MKEEKRFIKFQDNSIAGRKTKIWDVINTLDEDFIGEIKWSTAWRRYVFEPYTGTQFDGSCLNMLSAFCTAETNKHKIKKPRVARRLGPNLEYQRRSVGIETSNFS